MNTNNTQSTSSKVLGFFGSTVKTVASVAVAIAIPVGIIAGGVVAGHLALNKMAKKD